MKFFLVLDKRMASFSYPQCIHSFKHDRMPYLNMFNSTPFKMTQSINSLVINSRHMSHWNRYLRTNHTTVDSRLRHQILFLSVLKRIHPYILALIPKGFEKFYPNEMQQDNKQSASSIDKNTNNQRNNPPNGSNDNKKPNSYNLYLLISFLLLGTLLDLLGKNIPTSSDGTELTMQEFLTRFLLHGYVKRLELVNKEFVNIELREDIPEEIKPKQKKNYFFFRIGSLESFEKKLELFQQSMGIHPTEYIPVQHIQQVNYLNELMSYLPTLFFIFCSVVIVRRLSKIGSANDPQRFFRMGKANPSWGKDTKVKTKFSDVAGMNEAKNEIKEFVDFLRDPKKYERLGAHIPKGALLVGAPGTGKTLLARAVAGEANVPFYSMSGSDFIEVFVGVGPSRVRDLFAQARKNSPSIIFVDEIDAVGRKRARGNVTGAANDERENTLNQLLVEMDGFTSSTGVVVLAGTNRSDVLDPALTRPGRFDRTVHVEKPDLSERAAIFKIHMKPLKLDPSLNPIETNRRLAALTPGFVGADIQNICNEAAIYAARRNAIGVGIEDFENASERVLGGMKKSAGFMNDDIKRVVAFHEAGHAVTGWFTKYADPVLKVSIVPRTNGALGFAQNLPEEIQLIPKQQILDKIAVLLGGRVSEELNIGRVSTGAADDLDKVTKLSYAFVSVWGFNENVGLMSYQPHEDTSPHYRVYSEHLAQIIDKEVRQMIDQEYQRVRELLTEKKTLLHELANRLLQRETITFIDLKEVLGERPFPIKEEYFNYINANPGKPQFNTVSKDDTEPIDPPQKNENASPENDKDLKTPVENTSHSDSSTEAKQQVDLTSAKFLTYPQY